MKYTTEIDNIEDFPAWSGARDTLETVIKAGKAEELTALMEDIFSSETTDTEINDWLRYDSSQVFEMLRIDDEGSPFVECDGCGEESSIEVKFTRFTSELDQHCYVFVCPDCYDDYINDDSWYEW